MQPTVVIVEDEDHLGEAVVEYLEEREFRHGLTVAKPFSAGEVKALLDRFAP